MGHPLGLFLRTKVKQLLRIEAEIDLLHAQLNYRLPDAKNGSAKAMVDAAIGLEAAKALVRSSREILEEEF